MSASSENQVMAQPVGEAIKPGTERNGMEWNGTGSNCCTIRTWTPDMIWKIGQAHRCTES